MLLYVKDYENFCILKCDVTYVQIDVSLGPAFSN